MNSEVEKEKVIDEIPEATPEAATEPKPYKYADRLSKAYPNKKFESDEDRDKAFDDYLGNLEGYKEKGEIANKKLIALFESEPQVGDVVRDMINGSTFREALARHVSPEDLTAIEGDPDYEGWNKNKSAREESMKKRREFEDSYAKNLEFSKEAVSAFAQENGMDDSAAEKFLGKFDEMLAEINSGKITKETLLAMKKAFDYDSDVAKAAKQGEIAGRNQNIVAQKESTPLQGDGLPRPGVSSEAPEGDKKATPNYIDDLLARTKRRQVL